MGSQIALRQTPVFEPTKLTTFCDGKHPRCWRLSDASASRDDRSEAMEAHIDETGIFFRSKNPNLNNLSFF